MSKIHMHILDQVQVIYSQIFYSKTIMITQWNIFHHNVAIVVAITGTTYHIQLTRGDFVNIWVDQFDTPKLNFNWNSSKRQHTYSQ